MSNRMVEYSDRRVWDLTGFTLEQLRLAYQLELLFGGPESSKISSRAVPPSRSEVWVVIEPPLTLRIGTVSVQVVPEQAASVAPVLPLIHRTAASLAAFRNGTLRLTFEDGSEIEVLPHEQYESWHTYGTEEYVGIVMECTPHEGAPWYEG